MENFRTRFREMEDKEKANPVPHELVTGNMAPPTLRETIQSAIRTEISIMAQDRGMESFEEADDFELDDKEADPLTIYEVALMAPEDDESLDGAEPSPGEPPAVSGENAASEDAPGGTIEGDPLATPSPPGDSPAAS